MFAGSPLTVAKAEMVCRIYFYLGFAGLPFLWIMLWLYFRHHEMHSEVIKWYVKYSLRLGLAGFAAFLLLYVSLLLFLPKTSRLWIIAPGVDHWQPGWFSISPPD